MLPSMNNWWIIQKKHKVTMPNYGDSGRQVHLDSNQGRELHRQASGKRERAVGQQGTGGGQGAGEEVRVCGGRIPDGENYQEDGVARQGGGRGWEDV